MSQARLGLHRITVKLNLKPLPTFCLRFRVGSLANPLASCFFYGHQSFTPWSVLCAAGLLLRLLQSAFIRFSSLEQDETTVKHVDDTGTALSVHAMVA